VIDVVLISPKIRAMDRFEGNGVIRVDLQGKLFPWAFLSGTNNFVRIFISTNESSKSA